MTKAKNFLIPSLIFLSIFLMLIMPALSSADGLVPCNNNSATITPTDGSAPIVPTPCNFNALLALVNGVINFILYSMVIPIAAIMFAYAGFTMVTAGGEAAHARTKAKEIFSNTVIGLIIAMAAWLIVKLILINILHYNGAWIGFS